MLKFIVENFLHAINRFFYLFEYHNYVCIRITMLHIDKNTSLTRSFLKTISIVRRLLDDMTLDIASKCTSWAKFDKKIQSHKVEQHWTEGKIGRANFVWEKSEKIHKKWMPYFFESWKKLSIASLLWQITSLLLWIFDTNSRLRYGKTLKGHLARAMLIDIVYFMTVFFLLEIKT